VEKISYRSEKNSHFESSPRATQCEKTKSRPLFMGNQGESKVGSTEGLEKLMMSNSRFTSIIAEVFRVKAPVARCSPHR
jgi:hypothetical protein